MILHGTRPIPLDKRDYSYLRTFGAPAGIVFPDSFELDAGFGFPDQMLPNPYFGIGPLPYGCTEYMVNEMCTDEDKVRYNPGFTESKIHASERGGVDMREALDSACNDGVQTRDETTDEEAKTHKRTAYFRVGQNPDFFDGIRTVLMNNRPVGIGTPWYPAWENTARGVVPAISDYTKINGLPWHAWKISGWKTIGGQVYLKGKTWQGKGYGDEGWAHFSRDVINDVMKLLYTGAFTLAKATPAQIKKVGETYIFLHNLGYGMNSPEVAELQKALQSLGYTIVHAVTTQFLGETKAALAQFQKDHGIVDDGSHFGPQTRYAMNKVLNPSQTLFGDFLILVRTYLGV